MVLEVGNCEGGSTIQPWMIRSPTLLIESVPSPEMSSPPALLSSMKPHCPWCAFGFSTRTVQCCRGNARHSRRGSWRL